MNRIVCCFVFFLVFQSITVQAAAPFTEPPTELPREWLSSHLDSLESLYREFHKTPEISFQEKETARRLAAEFRKVGANVTTDVGGHGVVALLKNGVGPTVMFRTDLDALPVSEKTGLDYSSKVRIKDAAGKEVGVMHACGHDIHLTNIVGVARYLASHTEEWKGTAMFIGQPAEERGAGARAMLDDGLFTRFPKPDFAIALHVDAYLAAGRVGYRAGYALANVDSVDITLKGRGGHGSAPHTTVDPIVQAARLVVDLQTIVSREISAIEPAVVTVGSIHGGTKHNIIPDDCHLQITVRSYSPNVRKHLLAAIQRKAKATALSSGSKDAVVKISEGTPSLRNDPALVDRLLPVFHRVLGDRNVEESDPSMGGEDFSQYGLAGVPIFLFRLGSVDSERLAGFKKNGQTAPSLHSAVYYPDARETIETGVLVSTHAMLNLLQPERAEASQK